MAKIATKQGPKSKSGPGPTNVDKCVNCKYLQISGMNLDCQSVNHRNQCRKAVGLGKGPLPRIKPSPSSQSLSTFTTSF